MSTWDLALLRLGGSVSRCKTSLVWIFVQNWILFRLWCSGSNWGVSVLHGCCYRIREFGVLEVLFWFGRFGGVVWWSFSHLLFSSFISFIELLIPYSTLVQSLILSYQCPRLFNVFSSTLIPSYLLVVHFLFHPVSKYLTFYSLFVLLLTFDFVSSHLLHHSVFYIFPLLPLISLHKQLSISSIVPPSHLYRLFQCRLTVASPNPKLKPEGNVMHFYPSQNTNKT